MSINAQANPDGKIMHLSIYHHSAIVNLVPKTDGGHWSSGYAGSYGMMLPITGKATVILQYQLMDMERTTSNSFALGYNYYSRKADSSHQMQNPDGKDGSFYLGFLAGYNKEAMAGGMSLGLGCGSVTGRHITFEISDVFSTLKDAKGNELALSTSLHVFNRPQNEFINGDGSPLTVSFFPYVSFVMGDNSGIGFGGGLTMPLIKRFSISGMY